MMKDYLSSVHLSYISNVCCRFQRGKGTSLEFWLRSVQWEPALHFGMHTHISEQFQVLLIMLNSRNYFSKWNRFLQNTFWRLFYSATFWYFCRGDRLLIIGVHIAMSHSPEDQRSRYEAQTHHQRFGNNFLECDSQYSYNGCYYSRNSKWKN